MWVLPAAHVLAAMVQVACPLVRLTLLHPPMLLPPSAKATVPVGAGPVPDAGATTAVNVTGWVAMEGFADELRVVALSAFVAAAVTVFGDVVVAPGACAKAWIAVPPRVAVLTTIRTASSQARARPRGDLW